MSFHHWLPNILKQDFSSFVGKCSNTLNPAHAFRPNWHIDLIAEYLEAARSRQVRRLIINMPPRSLKSVCVSVAWPAWLLGHEPASRIIAASYALPLATKHSLDCRSIMQAGWYKQLFPSTRLRSDQNEKQKFMTHAHGFRLATSTHGSLTGEGGDYLIIDDPLNAIDARNKLERAHVQEWFEQSFATRLNDKEKGVIILVMQRLHAHDLSGYLLEQGHWEHLCLPAIAPEKTHYHFGAVDKSREREEALHAARESAEVLERIKHEIGSYAFAAQYQQTPVPEEGAMVRGWWLQRYTTMPDKFTRITQSWDTAIKAGCEHDASVCLTFGEAGQNIYLMHVLRTRLEYPDLKRACIEQAKHWKPNVVLIEDRASGQQLLQDLRRETTLPLVATSPRKEKTLRFAAVCPMLEAGRLYLPRAASWLADFEKELLEFPASAHDDQVDALSQFLAWYQDKAYFRLQLRKV